MWVCFMILLTCPFVLWLLCLRGRADDVCLSFGTAARIDWFINTGETVIQSNNLLNNVTFSSHPSCDTLFAFTCAKHSPITALGCMRTSVSVRMVTVNMIYITSHYTACLQISPFGMEWALKDKLRSHVWWSLKDVAVHHLLFMICQNSWLKDCEVACSFYL